jgi:hypothetical protein
MFDIVWIRSKVREGEYYFSRHGDQERQNDNLTVSEVEEALCTGRILEQYEDTGRGASCLVVGFTESGKPLHIVCGEIEDRVAIVTVHIPTPPKFKNPFERGS